MTRQELLESNRNRFQEQMAALEQLEGKLLISIGLCCMATGPMAGKPLIMIPEDMSQEEAREILLDCFNQLSAIER